MIRIPREKKREFESLKRPDEKEDANGQAEMELPRGRGLKIRCASIEFAIYAYEKISMYKLFR
jgi:hypothetical protein